MSTNNIFVETSYFYTNHRFIIISFHVYFFCFSRNIFHYILNKHFTKILAAAFHCYIPKPTRESESLLTLLGQKYLVHKQLIKDMARLQSLA